MKTATKKHRKAAGFSRGVRKKRLGCAKRPVTPNRGSDKFVFNLDSRGSHFTDRELIDELRRFAAAMNGGGGGRVLTRTLYHAWKDRRCGPETIYRRLGPWPQALARIGMTTRKVNQFSAEKLIDILERVWRKLGRAPGVMSLSRHGSISDAPYNRVWGSLTRARREFVRWQRGEISRKTLLRGIGKPPRRVSPRMRWRVMERDGKKCCVCGRGPGEVTLEVDHIVPVCRGGGDELSNLQVLCRKCNRGKGGRGARSERRGGRARSSAVSVLPVSSAAHKERTCPQPHLTNCCNRSRTGSTRAISRCS